MDISGRMRANNIVVSLVLALYFMLQTVGGISSVVSSIIIIPLAKKMVDRLVRPVDMCESAGYPLSELGINLIRDQYGIWVVIFLELIRRFLSSCPADGWLAIVLMMAFLVVYIFSMSTGVCITNTKNFQRGTVGFAVSTWLLFTISLLLGSCWIISW